MSSGLGDVDTGAVVTDELTGAVVSTCGLSVTSVVTVVTSVEAVVSGFVVIDTGLFVVVIAPTMIAPSVRVILSVIALPFVSVMNALDHFTGYVPFAQSAGTLNVRVMIVASSAAFMPLPMPSPNA